MSVLRIVILALFLLSGGLAHASVFLDSSPRATDEELDRMRGGFIVNLSGLEFLMAFSLERLTYINGNLMSAMTLNPFALTPLAHIGQAIAGLSTVENPGVPELPVASQNSGFSAAATGDIPIQAKSDVDMTSGMQIDALAAAPESGSAAGGGVISESSQPPVSTVAAAPSMFSPVASAKVTTQGALTVIQNGLGNTIALPSNISANALTTVIQNTLNDQVIRNVMIVNATIATQEFAAQARLNAMLGQGFNALR